MDLKLRIYHNNEVLGCSDLIYSSTELCKLPLSNSNSPYGIDITKDNNNAVTFGYAWSTDNMIEASVSDLGIYYIRNKNLDKYLRYDYTEINNNQSLKLETITSPNTLLESQYSWILNSSDLSDEIFYLNNGFGQSYNYINHSSLIYGLMYANISSQIQNIRLLENSDGSFSVFNSSLTRILYCVNDSIVLWYPYTYDEEDPDIITDHEKWYFDRVNYSVMDANADGSIDITDATFIQRCLVELETPSNIQTYLGDVNRNGELDILDAYCIQVYLS